MSLTQEILTIIIIILGTILTRFISFWVFPENKEAPQYIRYLGQVLPGALFALLVIYSFRNYHFPFNLSELIGVFASILVVAIHYLKRNLLLSISVGTIIYMILIQTL